MDAAAAPATGSGGARGACGHRAYQRREPEHTPLHRAVREHLATFMRDAAQRSESGLGLPGFVREEFERYLRCGSALNLNVHFHCVLPDGVFSRRGSAAEFHRLGAPSQAELDGVLRKIARRLTRLLRPPPDEPEPDTGDALAAAQRAEIWALRAGRDDDQRPRRHAAHADGFSLHAGVHLHANDREGLARLCAYGARGPLTQERLHALPDGRLLYVLKRALPDGRNSITLEPLELLRKLATLVPPPRRHLVR